MQVACALLGSLPCSRAEGFDGVSFLLQLHEWAQNYTVKVKGKPDVSPENATKDDVDDGGDFYFVNPEGEFIASYGPQVTPREMAEEWAEMMKCKSSAIVLQMLTSSLLSTPSNTINTNGIAYIEEQYGILS